MNDRKSLYWIDPKPRCSVYSSRFGFRVEVWQENTLLYSEVWDKKPSHADRMWLCHKYGRKADGPVSL